MTEKMLTKSLLMSALECPTKLYYATRPLEYANQSEIDPFLKELAKGGYQVGELAKVYFPDGQEISAGNIDEAIAATKTLLQQDKVTIFEAAILHNNLLVRIDILIKDGAHFDLIEVKAKSYDAHSTSIIGKKEGINSDWKPKIIDVAYQAHVLQLAYSGFSINSYLMLVNKNSAAVTNGLYQKFKLVEGQKKPVSVEISSDFSMSDLALDMLVKVNVDGAIGLILRNEEYDHGSFSDQVNYLAQQLKNGHKILPALGGKCRKCEFKCINDEEKNGLKSGFKECWQEDFRWTSEGFIQPKVLEIWNLKSNMLDSLIADGKVKITDMRIDDINDSSPTKRGMSQSQRQWLQIEKVQNNDLTPYLDIRSLSEEMNKWVFPLHFIDFETCKSAIPFLKGLRPYELIAFQFSHHTIDINGNVAHAGEYLNVKQG